MPRLRILVVDDQPMMTTMLRQILKQLGFSHVKQAEDGNIALAMIQEGDIDMLVTDLNMPALSGIELIQQIRQDATTRNMPIIVVSCESERDMVLEAMKSGADAFIVKPFAATTVWEKIAPVLRKRFCDPT